MSARRPEDSRDWADYWAQYFTAKSAAEVYHCVYHDWVDTESGLCHYCVVEMAEALWDWGCELTDQRTAMHLEMSKALGYENAGRYLLIASARSLEEENEKLKKQNEELLKLSRHEEGRDER